MINKIQLIRNIGLFGAFTGTAQTIFKKLTIIYAENGRGKTTLSAIFRSIANNDPVPIIERKRLCSQDVPHVVIDCDDATTPRVFQNGVWNGAYPNVRIFDDYFVHGNVHSGLEVTAGHRQNLHQLIIGRQGVELADRVEELTAQISQKQSELRDRASVITTVIRGPYSVDEFCALTSVDNIDQAIEQTQQRVNAFQQAEQVRSTLPFESFEPPTINIEAIRQILNRTLSDIDAAANEAVQAHLQKVGDHAEPWVAHGMEFIVSGRGNGQTCPFCDQPISGIPLVEHYRAYFSHTYIQHKNAIEQQLEEIDRILGENAFMRFNHLITQQQQRHIFWSGLTTLPSFNLNVDALTTVWQNVRNQLSRLLRQKLVAPLEEINFDDAAKEAMDEYLRLLELSRRLSRALLTTNEAITNLKEEAAAGSPAAASADLERLRASRARFSGDVIALCDAYMDTRRQREQAEAQKIQAREALDRHREETFPRYQTAINEYLRKFNAGFRIVEVEAVNPRGAPSSTYQIEIDSARVKLSQDSPDEPAFKNTLSAGDRNTLALAFFFASLDQERNRQSIVAVIDDPVSSLDDGRTLTTAQEIRELSRKVEQVILLSHSKRTLCSVWQHCDFQNSVALSVVPDTNGSTIEPWNVREAAITEYDRTHEFLRRYSTGSERDVRQVAQGLRYVLEGYLRVVCAEFFPPGSMIGQLTGKARDLLRQGRPILSESVINEIEAITEYANKFHHDTNSSWDIAINNINEQELKGFVDRVLAFTNNRMATAVI